MKSLQLLIGDPWFPWLNLAGAVAATLLLVVDPQVGIWAILPALAPWLLSLLAGRLPVVRSSLDLPLVLFLVTGGVGVWAAYQPQIAWAKFWLICAAILLFYALAALDEKGLWGITAILATFGVGISIIFLLSSDWGANPAKIELINRLGFWWMAVRPAFPLPPPFPPNVAAGIAAIMLPFLIALGLHAWRPPFTRRQSPQFWLTAAGSGLVIFTIILSTSRGVWLALTGSSALLLFYALSRWLPQRKSISIQIIICLAVGFLALLAWLQPELLAWWLRPSPQTGETASRQNLVRVALELIRDAPFTGGGLGGFPGLYSQYILNIPFYVIPYSHNTWLDAGIEQGVLGMASLAWVYLGSMWGLLSKKGRAASPLLHGAILSGLLVILLHGLSEDIVYNARQTPLLFVLPGMAVALNRLGSIPAAPAPPIGSRKRLAGFAISILALGALLAGGWLFAPRWLSTWYANLGAVRMAQLDLADYPSGQWREVSFAARLAPVEPLFTQALYYDPLQPTAHYRLGLIDMLRRDYPSAIAHLQVAYQADPFHRGVIKSLGYCYTWTGQLDRALPLLAQIPEASSELETYSGWYHTQNRHDLAARSRTAAERLKIE